MATLLASIPWWRVALVQGMGFVLLLMILAKWVFPFLRKLLGERRKEFEETFGRLEHETQDASRKLKELREKVRTQEAEGKRRIAAGLEEGARAKEQALNDANFQAEGILLRASREVDIEQQKAILELRHEVTLLTLRAAEALTTKLVTPQVHERLVNEYLEDLDKVKS